MPKCLLKYQWVKLPRAHLPAGKGIMGYWAKLASRSAFRKGQAHYCGYTNDVMPGMWSGGMVGLKSILGVKSQSAALEIMEELQRFGYLRYTLDARTKKLEYTITDWVVKCYGAECMAGTVYATEGYGFLCLPRSITQRLAKQSYTFGESDAWLDLWCHTTWMDTHNVFSCLAPAVQYGKMGAVLTLETLGQRWGWEKTKVWRFFKSMGMLSLCIVFPVPMAASFSTNCIPWIQRFHCLPTQNLNALLKKCVFVPGIRTLQARTICV